MKIGLNDKMKLGDLLKSVGKITDEQLSDALNIQKNSGKKLGEILVEKGYVTELDIIQVLEFQFGIPHIDLNNYIIDPEIPKLITENLAKRHLVIPIKKDRGKLIVAMADPLNVFAIDDIEMGTNLKVEPAISTKKDISNAIEQYYGKQSAEKAIEDFKRQYEVENIEEIDEEILNEINNAPAVRLVNSIIRQAVKARASDIHIEPYENLLRVRFRIDGSLQEIMTPAKSTHSAIVTRIKIMGKMNIAEKRIPQDGRIETNVDGREVDLRISILPTVYGEKIVIRILDRSNFLLKKSQLGFTEKNLMLFDNIIKNPNGIILVTGPTGSGKTTTLYSTLSELNTVNKNIITVEDPVEYKLDGINQVQVNNKTGLTFANGLRAILRQDPDIIMVGEIRDIETAQIAVRAAITGHLVISTMHTNDAPSTITRLLDMGIQPYLISSSMVGVVAQRLVRKICDRCKYQYLPSEKEMKLLGINDETPLYKGKGCSHCYYTGYKGRTAIHEVMPIDKKIRDLINNKISIDSIKNEAIESGMTTLRENCTELVLKGETTVEELLRVTYTLE
ncbi:type II secretion system ATPase GspE [Caldisalinibacter kiritimatiensis]|uniref:protein-secreting ATPase n=1 Tax=Caldisalinibacter kiritimatiensis TaxID=1304284 RepID=R1ASI6_9FIRM|nr:type II secretion system ATPase GspE [Caldisalinibacter kiritimatiensis]EOD00113.1 Type IV fimbrial assembly, ATPase PilB [Caldisalinibacter kiritimatiensis]